MIAIVTRNFPFALGRVIEGIVRLGQRKCHVELDTTGALDSPDSDYNKVKLRVLVIVA